MKWICGRGDHQMNDDKRTEVSSEPETRTTYASE